MLEVYFESDKEVMTFCEHLFQYNKEIELYWKTHKDWGNHIQFKPDAFNEHSIDAIAKSMADVFITHRLPGTIRSIIKGKFYFRNTEEIERILGLSHWIFTGKDPDCLRVRKNKEPVEVLRSLFVSNIKNTTTVHFDSIVNFRLTVFKEQLIHYVGLAIEEFKREEDHQNFINMLREYIENKKSECDEIHIVQGNKFSFFRPDGKQFSAMELRKVMHEEPLYIVGLDIDEMNLSPLIAMAPARIKIYGDDPSEPKTLTVINVFQERVTFESFGNFPFPYYLKNL